MAKEHIFGQMVRNTMATGMKIGLLVLELINGVMVANTQEIGKMI